MGLNLIRMSERIADLQNDVYAQPEDPGHKGWGVSAINQLMVYAPEAHSVLDIGCGQGMFRETFINLGRHWVGVTLGPDFAVCLEKGLQVYERDMTNLPFTDETYDLLFARHVLEHSPFPILTLMEWRRVSKKYLLLVAPCPYHWGWIGRNHYSMAPEPQLEWWLARSGWAIEKKMYLMAEEDEFTSAWLQSWKNRSETPPAEIPAPGPVEYRFLCVKTEPRRE